MASPMQGQLDPDPDISFKGDDQVASNGDPPTITSTVVPPPLPPRPPERERQPQRLPPPLPPRRAPRTPSPVKPEQRENGEAPAVPFTPVPDHLQPNKFPLPPPLPSNAHAAISLAIAQSQTPESLPETNVNGVLGSPLDTDAPSAPVDHVKIPSPTQVEIIDVHKSLPTPPSRFETPISSPTPVHELTPIHQVHGSSGQGTPGSATPAKGLGLAAQSTRTAAQPAPTTSSHAPAPADLNHSHRATLGEKTRAVHEMAAQHSAKGEAPPIIQNLVLGISPLMWGAIGIIALLSLPLFGVNLFLKIIAFALAPVIALWVLPLPSVAESERNPPPQPADNVGWINHTLRTLFPLVSTDVLTPFVDLLEDALIHQVPPIVTSVRCTDVTLGREPIQLTSLRAISDDDWFATITESQGHVRTPRSTTPGVQPSGSPAPDSGRFPDRRSSFGSPFASRKTHKRTTSYGSTKSSKSNRRASGPPAQSRPVSGSSQLSSFKGEEERLKRRDRIVRRLRHGRRKQQDDGHDETMHWDTEDSHHNADLEAEEEELGKGFFVNYEVSFTYNNTREMARRGTGLHMLAHFGWGVRGLGGSEIPVFIDVLKLSGTLRLRLLLSPSPPFVRDALFTFVQMPEFDISARPLRSIGFGSINAMDIPLLKSYVQKSIAQVAGAFVSPRHYHLDVDRLLLGKDAAVRTSSVGVLYLIIHGCTDLPRTDAMGSCDPYVVASYSKFDKPLFSTRTIVDTLDPLYEESAFLLVPAESVEVGEKLRLKVCDSDRFSMDDAIGRITVDLAEIIEKSEKFEGHGYQLFRRCDDLEPDQPGMKVQGQIDWSVRFFPLWQIPQPEFERRLAAIKDRRGEGKTTPPWWLQWLEDWMEKPDWEKERGDRRKEMVEYFTGERERDELEAAMPPTGEFPAGVLQFHVHQCAELEMDRTTGTYSGSNISRRKSAASGKPALSDILDRAPGENPDPPSAYCEVHINDKYIFRTRTKRVNPQPYFNALSERFIRDWRQAKISFVVKDERDREHDPIIGVVSLRLKDVLHDRSQITRWLPLVGGLGFGKLRISLLFKPVDIKLPRGVSSYEACTFDMTSLVTTDFEDGLGRFPTLMVESEYDRAVLQPPGPGPDDFGASRESLDIRPKNGGSSTDVSKSSRRVSMPRRESRPLSVPRPGSTVEWELSQPIRLAIQYRHSCSILFSLVTRHIIKKTKVHALAVLRVTDVPDDESTRRTIPIFATGSVRDAMRANAAFTDYVQTDAPGGIPANLPGDVKVIGFVQVTFVLHPGVSRAHRKLRKRDFKFKSVYDAWEATRLLSASAAPPEAERDCGGDSSDGYDSDEEDDDSMDEELDDRGRGKEAAAAMRDDDTREMIEASKSHKKALHKRNKGIFQLKLARTGKFVKDKVQARVLSTTASTNLAARPHGADLEVEHEGQSKL